MRERLGKIRELGLVHLFVMWATANIAAGSAILLIAVGMPEEIAIPSLVASVVPAWIRIDSSWRRPSGDL